MADHDLLQTRASVRCAHDISVQAFAEGKQTQGPRRPALMKHLTDLKTVLHKLEERLDKLVKEGKEES